MKDERIIEEMARLEGVELIGKKKVGRKYGAPVLINYLECHNCCQRVIDVMRLDIQMSIYPQYLMGVVFYADDDEVVVEWSKLLESYCATPRQKCEALLKAVGKWEDSE